MNARDLIAAVAALTASVCFATCGATAQDSEYETEDAVDIYVGVSGAMTLPQGGSDRMRRLGGAAVRAGWYLGEFWSVEGEAAWLENSAGFAAQGLWHWQSADVYGRMFGYSQFDPFFTFGARGWLGRGIGQVGPKAGVGAFWHLTDNWSLRADADATLGLDGDVEVHYTLSAGVQYSF